MASLQEIAEEMSRALACLADRICWPYCPPVIAERCSELREEIVGAHEVYRRYATHNNKHFLLLDLYDGLARLFGGSLASSTALDYAPRDSGGNIISVQDWVAFRISITKPLAWEREIVVFKKPLVKTVESNSLDEHRARRRDRMQGGLGSATLPSEPGLAAVANEAAPHQTDADAAAARGPSSPDLIMVEIDANEIVGGLSSLIDFDHGYGDDDDGISVDETVIQNHATTCGKGSTTAPTTATGKEIHITTSPIFRSGSSARPTAIHVGDQSEQRSGGILLATEVPAHYEQCSRTSRPHRLFYAGVHARSPRPGGLLLS